jgi:hypothetical protein
VLFGPSLFRGYPKVAPGETDASYAILEGRLNPSRRVKKEKAIWIRQGGQEKTISARREKFLIPLHPNIPPGSDREKPGPGGSSVLELGVAPIGLVLAFAFLALGLARSLLPPPTTGGSSRHRLISS